MSLNHPCFEDRPIGSPEALGRALGIDISRLVGIGHRSDRLYRRRIFVRKPGKKPRPVYPAGPVLRDVQQRILDRILKRAKLPTYLMGGVPGRSYVGNARHHSRAKVLFGQDVESFYPSISIEHVEMIFLDVFHFPPSVSALLAKLCTRKGELVQGGVASTFIANLALYRTEPRVVEICQRLGLRYSRFVDDIHVSAKRWLPPAERARFMQMTRAALEQHGYKPKREKQFVVTRAGPMQVHRLNVNSSASTPRARRQSLRNEVFLLERWADMQSWDAALERAYLRVSSRVGQLKQMNPGDSRRLRHRLRALETRRAACRRQILPTVG